MRKQNRVTRGIGVNTVLHVLQTEINLMKDERRLLHYI